MIRRYYACWELDLGAISVYVYRHGLRGWNGRRVVLRAGKRVA